jgi:hypothetical protein
MTLRGRLIDSDQPESAIALMVKKQARTNVLGPEGEVGTDGLYQYSGSVYFGGGEHRDDIKVLHMLFEAAYANARDALLIESAVLDLDALVRALSNVPQYSHLKRDQVALSFVHFDDLYGSVAVVREDKLSRAQFLVDQFAQQGQSCFRPVRCLTSDGNCTILPPIVESNNGTLVLMDGAHRMFAHMMKGKTGAECVVLSTEAKLPSTPVQFRDVRIVARKLPRERSFAQYDPAAFRPLKAALREILECG